MDPRGWGRKDREKSVIQDIKRKRKKTDSLTEQKIEALKTCFYEGGGLKL
jgi:hypothetical protein